MRMTRIANYVALQTIGYVIGGTTNVNIYIREDGYTKEQIYKGLYKDFVKAEMYKYENCKVSELRAEKEVLCIGIER